MTAPYFETDDVTLYLGDCLDVLRAMPDASVDAMVTDPPAGIAFMGRDWDRDKGGREQWIAWLADVMGEACRVLKPGGHAVVWAFPRTSHWTAMALEDAGFEIRDCIVHIFGSGFPKSLDVSAAIDKAKRRDYVLAAIDLGLQVPGNNLHDWTKAEHSPGDAWWNKFKAHLSPEDWGRVERAVVGQRTSGSTAGMQQLGPSGIKGGVYDVTAAASDDAKRWEGWGTALKPGQEHWWLVRKPLVGTVAHNVVTYGTGALNVNGCRVEIGAEELAALQAKDGNVTGLDDRRGVYGRGTRRPHGNPDGRWPTNLVLTHSATCVEDGPCAGDCPVAELDRQSGRTVSRVGKPRGAAAGDGCGMTKTGTEYSDEGGASRFFPVFRYEAKAPSAERPRLPDGTAHPTVKPLALLRWLVRLITPPHGVVLDPFAGSGTTGEACLIEGFNAVLIELEPAHCDLIKARLSKAIQPALTLDIEGAARA